MESLGESYQGVGNAETVRATQMKLKKIMGGFGTDEDLMSLDGHDDDDLDIDEDVTYVPEISPFSSSSTNRNNPNPEADRIRGELEQLRESLKVFARPPPPFSPISSPLALSLPVLLKRVHQLV